MIEGATEAAAKQASRAEICRALYQLAKPRIVAAITLSGVTAMVVAARGLPNGSLVFACSLSLLLTAAASAMINCVLETSLDVKMGRLERRNRHLGQAGTTVTVATATALFSAGLAVSAAALGPWPTALLCGGVLGYTVFYTVMLKPHTPWAAVLGSLPGALPVLVGGTVKSFPPEPGVLILFLILLLWQPPHFWLLALAYRDEYRQAGIPVLAVTGDIVVVRRSILWGAFFVTAASLLLYGQGYCSYRYAVAALAAGSLFWGCCWRCLKSEGRYRYAFRASVVYLLVLFGLILLDILLTSR